MNTQNMPSRQYFLHSVEPWEVLARACSGVQHEGVRPSSRSDVSSVLVIRSRGDENAVVLAERLEAELRSPVRVTTGLGVHERCVA